MTKDNTVGPLWILNLLKDCCDGFVDVLLKSGWFIFKARVFARVNQDGGQVS